jgi:S-DNA-T family DNA segregation ATPase FtsK/SpoIIIE
MSWMPELSERRRQQVLGVLLVALAALTGASLFTYRAPVEGARPWAEPNASGPLGAWLAHGLHSLLGRAAAWGIPLAALAFGWNRLRGAPLRPLAVRAAVGTLLVVELLALVGLLGARAAAWSGALGAGLGAASLSLAGVTGSAILLGALFTVTLLVASELGFSALSLAWAYAVRLPASAFWQRATEVWARIVEGGDGEPERAPRARPRGRAGDSAAESALEPRPAVREVRIRSAEGMPREEAEAAPAAAVASPGLPPGRGQREEGERVRVRPSPAAAGSEARPAEARVLRRAVPEPVPHAGPLPPLELLEANPAARVSLSHEELLAEAALLRSRLADFGIRGEVTEIHPGPVVTTFEFAPAPGVKVSQITSREDDLALALRAQRIRILAPIPGKAAVGVEIPNRSPRTVYFREVLGSPEYANFSGRLRFALGVDVNGVPMAADLTAMPHLLVAGATGSGKSVYLNVLISSLLFGKGPDELRLLMIDPKMIELAAYNGIPHLLMPVVTDARKAARSLRWAVGEMERRYKLFASTGSRNIESFNRRVTGPSPPVGEDGEVLAPLPLLVLIVDELADLMLSMPVEMEEPIGRLAQMARAVGLHLVLATQRPSVDVITGVIKANFPSRIAFQVSSKVDSRTILDMNGAENLLGRGDMLFLPAGRPEPVRVHGPYTSEAETARVVAFWRERAPSGEGPSTVEEVVSRAVESDEEDDDALVPEAVRLVVMHQQGSTSLLQRRLKVGYSRASRLMDRLESLGVVGPFVGSKAREVLVNESYLEEHNLR